MEDWLLANILAVISVCTAFKLRRKDGKGKKTTFAMQLVACQSAFIFGMYWFTKQQADRADVLNYAALGSLLAVVIVMPRIRRAP